MTAHEDPNRDKVFAAGSHLALLEVRAGVMRLRHQAGLDITEDLDHVDTVLAELRADLGLSPLLTRAGR